MFGHTDDQQTLNHASVLSAPSDNSQPGTQLDDSLTASAATVDETHGQPALHPAAALLEPKPDDLLAIKQQALSQLQPLVSHLDQEPEERFRTLMMMIQASDDQSLIKSAFEAAEHIGDDKQKAQALLDIVNEINYFTHPQTDA